jgi:hypothetical protein
MERHGKAGKAVMVWYSKTRSGNGLARRFRFGRVRRGVVC